jgi:TfoX/Sxy family transcriptional regulator of competence genes
MAYDESLADRIRAHLSGHPGVTERKMFGGIAFMVSGNMAVGVSKDELMVRIDPDQQDDALAMPGVRVFDMTGRPMRGWVLVAPDSTGGDDDLRRWVDTGLDFAHSLPPK